MVLDLTWDQYRTKIAEKDADAASRHTAALAPRLEVLRHCGSWFDSAASFVHLDAPERMAIAGTLRADKDKNYLLRTYRTDVDFGIFGAMGGSGRFARWVKDKKGALALGRALDIIPRDAEVTAEQYGQFIDAFCGTMDVENPVATSSRLLAMKRPDVFMCRTSGNSQGLARALRHSASEVTVQTYWDLVISPIHSSPWYKSPPPADEMERTLWQGRVALLDLIFAEFQA